MVLLILASALWLAIHLGLAGTRLRDAAVGVLNEKVFAGVFSVLALTSLVLLIVAYNRAGTMPLWYAPPWLVAVIDAAMVAAFVLLVGAVIPPRGDGEGPRGMFRVTRHPMLCAFGLWAMCHMIVNGDTASLVFFGTFLVTVLAGIPSLDAKLARRDPGKAASVQAVTSRLPFAAILAGRTRFVAAEIGWLPPLVGILAWAAVLHLHKLIIGASALPVW